MSEETQTCDNCDKVSTAWYLQGGKRFCNEPCARDYHATSKELKDSFPQETTSVMLDATEIRTIEQAENELIINLNQEQLMCRLALYKRQYMELRARERITHSRINKLVALGEQGKTERYRALGVNSDLEAKRKVHNVMQKSIISYRKMGMDDQKIKAMMINDLEFEAEKVEIAFKEL